MDDLTQCGNTQVHPAHPWTHPLGGVDFTCPGLDGTEACQHPGWEDQPNGEWECTACGTAVLIGDATPAALGALQTALRDGRTETTPADYTVPEDGPLSVTCPDCIAPPGADCRISNPAMAGSVHGQRARVADLRGLERGTCALCGRFMVRGSVEGSPVDAWHPRPEDHNCPPMPDPAKDWNGYATQINLGLTPGHPGIEHFLTEAATEVTGG